MTSLDKIKLILDIESDVDIEDDSLDEVLGLFLEKAELWVRTVCGIGLIPLDEPLMNAVEDLAVIRYNKLGSEGLSTESVGPLNMSYEDVPREIVSVLDKYKKVCF